MTNNWPYWHSHKARSHNHYYRSSLDVCTEPTLGVLHCLGANEGEVLCDIPMRTHLGMMVQGAVALMGSSHTLVTSILSVRRTTKWLQCHLHPKFWEMNDSK